MGDKKHIDRLFQEKLKDFEVTPNDAIWKSIENELHEKKRKRRVIPLWWQIGGVAAVLTLLFTVGSLVFNDSVESNSTQPVVNANEKDSSSEVTSTNHPISNTDLDQTVVSNSGNEEEPDSNSTVKGLVNESQTKDTSLTNQETRSEGNGNHKKENTLVNQLPNNSENVVVSNSSLKKEDEGKTSPNLPELDQTIIDDGKNLAKTNALVNPIDANESNVNTSMANVQPEEDISKLNEIIPEKESQSIEDAIAEVNNTDEREKGEKLNRWNVSTTVAPVYFNSLGNGSSLDEQLVGNSKSGEINLSYGINGTYAVNEKLKVRAGINKVDLGYSTNDVIVYKSTGISRLSALSTDHSHIQFKDNTESTSIMSTQNLSFASVPEILATNVSSTLNQKFGFIEVPVEIEYALLSKKLGVNVIGGFSTFFLDKNKVYSTLNGEKSLLGEANNINSTSYSANFGFGLNYSVSDKVKFIFEPTFKYQIRTFRDTSGNFQPYFIGIYTGLNYKF